VVRVDEADISLSIKRVSRSDSERKLQEYKRERNAEKLLEQMGKKFGKSLEKTYDDIGYRMQDEFGSLHKAFDIALRNPGLLTEKGIDKKWAETIIETANKGFSEKTYEVKADLMLSSYSPKGLDIIKDALVKLEGTGLEVRYISAPRYQVVGRGKNIKELRGLVASASEQAIALVSRAGGEGSFAIEE
jgi:translation initiation factor 2 subunit 1